MHNIVSIANVAKPPVVNHGQHDCIWLRHTLGARTNNKKQKGPHRILHIMARHELSIYTDWSTALPGRFSPSRKRTTTTTSRRNNDMIPIDGLLNLLCDVRLELLSFISRFFE